jgi:hypothetical protein
MKRQKLESVCSGVAIIAFLDLFSLGMFASGLDGRVGRDRIEYRYDGGT